MSEFKHVRPLDGPVDEGTGGVGDGRIRQVVDDQTGVIGAMPKRNRNELPRQPKRG